MQKIIHLIIIMVCLTSLVSCGSSGSTTKTTEAQKIAPDTVTTMSGLQYVDNVKGKGKKVENGMKLKIDYAGYLTDGKLFDTSIKEIGDKHNYNRGGYPFTPLEFVVGQGQVIKGWEEGLTTNIYVGGSRRLIIPYNLAYGEAGRPPVIPPRAVLLFDVTVLDAN